MKTIILFLTLVSCAVAQWDYQYGGHVILSAGNSKHVTNPVPNNGMRDDVLPQITSGQNALSNTNVRWEYAEPLAIAEQLAVSKNGKYSVTGWGLNNHRISFYGNSGSTPLWEYNVAPGPFVNFVALSDTGGVIAAGSFLNILAFRNTSNTPVFDFDLTRLSDTGRATALDVTSNGQFIVASASRTDSSTILGFNLTSANPVWQKRIVPTVTTGGASVQGVRICGNDSLVIVNTYAEFFVMNTFTGQILFSGLINPSSPSSGTQSPQGISSNGNILATINYSGILRVYQRAGNTYNFLWQNQEPPGQFFNWYTTVDVSNDGEFISAGTLNFITSSSYDGKVKVFKRNGNGTPFWTYAGCGDYVTAVSFSGSANILAASSWGDFNGGTEDLYLFKTQRGNVPFYKLGTSGSLFVLGISSDGRTVVSGGKAVHARQFGSGGLLYNIDVDTSENPTGINPVSIGNPDGFELYQNYPNPFNPVTRITFDLPHNSGNPALKVFDIRGKTVADLLEGIAPKPGRNVLLFDAKALAGGIYFIALEMNGRMQTRKMILLK